jgi:molybdopterin-guanine dinucleotide biosynthesis protein A
MTDEGPKPATAIVLAGGRSERFGRDKLAEPLAGRPLLHHAIEAVRAVAADVVVVAAPGARPELPFDVRLVHDARPHEGPLAGLLAGLEAAREPLTLVVGGDMPTLDRAVLGALIGALRSSAVDAAALEHDGRRQQLPIALRTGPAALEARRLVDAGERRLGAILDGLAVQVLRAVDERGSDPVAATLTDVDRPGDLTTG